MTDIIITTPQTEIERSAQEAADAIANGGGWYFRRLATFPKMLKKGDRVWYVEDGYIRGFCIVAKIYNGHQPFYCTTTKRNWPAGVYIIMSADSWKWIRPVPHMSFRGFRYVPPLDAKYLINMGGILGDWKTPKPEVA